MGGGSSAGGRAVPHGEREEVTQCLVVTEQGLLGKGPERGGAWALVEQAAANAVAGGEGKARELVVARAAVVLVGTGAAGRAMR